MGELARVSRPGEVTDNTGRRAMVLPALSCAVVCYFAYYAIWGSRGVLAASITADGSIGALPLNSSITWL